MEFLSQKKKVPDGKLVTHQSPFPLPFQRRPWKRGLSIVSLSKIHAAPTLYEKLDEPGTDLLVFRVSVRGEKKISTRAPFFSKRQRSDDDDDDRFENFHKRIEKLSIIFS